MPSRASSKRPMRRPAAPVKEPRSWPNSSLSTRLGDSAAQSTCAYGRAVPPHMSCSTRATLPFPVPVSPVRSTVVFKGAMICTCSRRLLIAWLSPTIRSTADPCARPSMTIPRHPASPPLDVSGRDPPVHWQAMSVQRRRINAERRQSGGDRGSDQQRGHTTAKCGKEP